MHAFTDPSPFTAYLRELHATLRSNTDGAIPDYIPELAKAAPDAFGISFATVDGHVYSVGDATEPFTIQSVSKPFMYGDALYRLGADRVYEQVGVAPTGEAFNAIVLDDVHNRPFNPMVNAGAIAISELVAGADHAERLASMRAVFDRFAGRRLGMDEAVYRSESATGHRNRAIAYLMLNTGMIGRDPEQVLDLYFQQCSVTVTCRDLAVMGATLANYGINPCTGEKVLEPDNVRDVLTLMMSCGMYDYAGEWSYEVGLPAKSGVSGGILAILPGQLSVAIWSPPLDSIGNSVRGIAACKAISADFGLHMFMNAADVAQVIRRECRGDQVHSLRTRSPADREILRQEGHRIGLFELQGALFFASAERLIRRVQAVAGEIEYVLFDFKRVHLVDEAATRFLVELIGSLKARSITVAFAELGGPNADRHVLDAVAGLAAVRDVELYDSADEALQSMEERLLAPRRTPTDLTKFALDRIDLFAGLTPAELRLVETAVQAMQFDRGQTILKKGDRAALFFVIARGVVSIELPREGGPPIRIASLGPGQFFGEMALLEDGVRSADVIAEEPVVCYAMSVERLMAISQDHPRIAMEVLRNMAREFSARVRRGHAIIEALQ
ncbi:MULTISPECIES: glutaminase A [unclassified Roseitalea]|uniref:glutaminase A n=1 Tax=unclassified Roseitalea TaxID=2639107 RepID=UPI00273EECDB|nr:MULTISPECIES: glutaminase A [unclassified Roseitalea]